MDSFSQKVSDPSLKALLLDEETLTEAAIDAMVSRFLAQVKDGTWGAQGWPKVWTDYSVSKLALNAYSRLLARRLQARGARVSVNCFCPGFTRTDMTRGWGKRTAEEAAAAAARRAPHGGLLQVVHATALLQAVTCRATPPARAPRPWRPQEYMYVALV